MLYILHYELTMSTTILVYSLLFCRIAIALVFASSFFGKLTDLHTVEETISQFDLFPKRFSHLAAWLLLGSELTVVLLMLLDGIWLGLGLTLAACLLLGFSLALASVLARKIRTSCNCFGASKKSVSTYDLWRNACFIACALGGCGAALSLKNVPIRPELWELSLTALAAIVFVGIATQLDEIAQLFRQV